MVFVKKMFQHFLKFQKVGTFCISLIMSQKAFLKQLRISKRYRNHIRFFSLSKRFLKKHFKGCRESPIDQASLRRLTSLSRCLPPPRPFQFGWPEAESPQGFITGGRQTGLEPGPYHRALREMCFPDQKKHNIIFLKTFQPCLGVPLHAFL